MRQMPEYLQPLLSECAQCDRRPLRLPFIQAGHLCLTNGHVLVRLPGEDWIVPAYDERDGRRPDCSTLIHPHMLDAQFVPPPKPEIRVTESKCDLCDGTRRVRPCPKCFGDGCAKCDQKGWLKGHKGELAKDEACHKCDADGIVRTRTPRCFMMRNRWMDSGMWHLIAGLPGLQIIKHFPPPRTSKIMSPITFVFDDGHGLFMPLAEPWPEGDA